MSKHAWLSLISIALLTSCANGTEGDEDGVIKGRADTRVGETSASAEDTGASTEEDSATANDSAVGDSGATDSATTDSGADTGPPGDTGPTACAAEEPEPNDTPATARVLGAIDDCDGSGKSVSGVLSTSSDVDVLTFDGKDTLGCSVNPTVTVTGPVKVCIKAACKSATTEFKGCPKGSASGSECCSTSVVEIDVNCSGTTSEDTKVTITVSADGAGVMCGGYTLAYHY